MVNIQSAAAAIMRGIKIRKKIEDRKKPHGKNILSASATQGGHNDVIWKKAQQKPIGQLSIAVGSFIQ